MGILESLFIFIHKDSAITYNHLCIGAERRETCYLRISE